MKANKKGKEHWVAVNVTLLVPLPKADMKYGAREAMEMAREILQELPVEVGGVRVKVV